jgi:hypothetical protein
MADRPAKRRRGEAYLASVPSPHDKMRAGLGTDNFHHVATNEVPTANPKQLTAKQAIVRSMSDLCRLIWCALDRVFQSRAALEAEILVRH